MDDCDEAPLERVEAELCTLAGQIAAATCRFLVLLGDFDAREGWAGWNVRSCAQWLSWRCGLDLRTAREHVRVARALRELPRLREAFEAGRLSYSKVRAVARVAAPHTEGDLVEAALVAPASQIERLTRGLRTVQRIAASDAAAARGEVQEPRTSVRWWWDVDGTLVVSGRLTAEDGAQLLAALTRAQEMRVRDGGSAEPGTDQEPRSASARDRRGDVDPCPPSEVGPALVTMAQVLRDAVAPPTHAPVADVVVHVDATTLTAPDAVDGIERTGTEQAEPRLDDGPALTATVARRLACDGRIALAVHGSDGRTLDVGRWRRRPTAAQKAALWRRDRGCAVPGCGRTRFLHAHHVRHWARGGRTSLDNLVLLCGDHHRDLHEGRFSVVALGRQRFRFYGRAGAEYPIAPAVRGSSDAVAAAHPHVTPTTIEPDWAGHALDLHAAVTTYLQNWQLDERRRAKGDRAVSEVVAASTATSV